MRCVVDASLKSDKEQTSQITSKNEESSNVTKDSEVSKLGSNDLISHKEVSSANESKKF